LLAFMQRDELRIAIDISSDGGDKVD
jgi:hypothetical protein